MAEESLDVFGQLIATGLRDRGIGHLEELLAGRCQAPSLRALQAELGVLSPEQRSLVRRAVVSSLDGAVHDFLFALQEQADADGPVHIFVNGRKVAKDSDGLQGEPYGATGWYARFSEHGEPEEPA